MTPRAAARPAFRLLAICGERDQIAALVSAAREAPIVPIGLMLRDLMHRYEATAELCKAYRSLDPPANIIPIANGHRIPGIPNVHFTSQQLADGVIADRAESEIVAGASIHAAHEVPQAVSAGVAYLTYSPVYTTDSKPGRRAHGVSALRRVCAAAPIPIYALGGIDSPDRIGRCIAAGAFGVAGISLFRSPSAERLLELHEVIEHASTLYDRRL